MDAVLLCAGLGTRLRPHTLTTPKPLLPVRGRPILDWTLGALPKEVDRIIVVVHYLAEQIEAYLRGQRFSRIGRLFPRASRAAPAMHCGAAATSIRSDHFLVLNGDDLFGAADLRALAECAAGVLCAPRRRAA